MTDNKENADCSTRQGSEVSGDCLPGEVLQGCSNLGKSRQMYF